VTRSSITFIVEPFAQVTRMDAGASVSLVCVITKCHSVLSQSWSLRAFAKIVTVVPPPVVDVEVLVPVLVPVDVFVPVDVVVTPPVDVLVPVLVPVDVFVVVEVPVDVFVVVEVPVDVFVDVPPDVLDELLVPCSHSTQKTLCFESPSVIGMVCFAQSL
jgi:hypothetical protein